MKKYENLDVTEEYDKINYMIKNNMIKFGFYNSSMELQLIELCHNKCDNTIEMNFRDTMSEHIAALKKLNCKKENT